ncbi:hypothetical protein H1230_13375 [Paenibacillus sp. 19GGS1-52]|uniref:hypothetical protein n=1 Tax=Paenibacillus sp. 19GGS1-52 TaxID=2758563 RepID=UPI001EFA7204|nr:hypothetical protein [Paenibacillus sp. 19GGS1-52]ULO09671.1 hypothetical protein H1230_13375 [Paenibacillus sp. 19GGS1-52]
MTKANQHDTKLTLELLIAKKAQRLNRKMRTKDVYVDSLDCMVTLNEPSKELVYKFSDRIQESDGSTAEKFMAFSYIISQCVDLFKDKSFYEEYGTPELAVHELLTFNDINILQTELNGLTYVNGVNEEIKN